MRTLRILIVAAFALVANVAAYANHYADFYVIPIAGHIPGANGTMWMSDVAIQNFQSTPITVQFVVIESGFQSDNVFPVATDDDESGSVTILAGGNVLIKDILANHRGMTSVTGALLVGSDRPFAVTSRTYNMSSSGTFGQTVPPAANFLDNTLSNINLATAVAYVPGLVQNNDMRTNLGFVAANGSGSGATMNLAITIRGGNGTTLGTRNYSIAPGAVLQIQFPARDITGSDFNVAGAEFRITTGTGSVVPYASVVDNHTGDAVFVMGNFPQNDTSALGIGTNPRSLFRSILDRMSVYPSK